MDEVNNVSDETKNKCSVCGCKNTETAKFCVECGENLKNTPEPTEETETVCYSCGTISPIGIKFCPECGQNLQDQNVSKSANSSLSGLVNNQRSIIQRKGLLHKLASDVGKVAIKAQDDIIKSIEDYTLDLEVDVKETQEDYLLTVELPKIKKEDLDINITTSKINLKAEFDHEVEVAQGTMIVRKEIHRGSFNKDIFLPNEIIPEKAEADYNNDILIIKLPKAHIEKAHKLEL